MQQEEFTTEEMLLIIEKLLTKTTEISSLLKDGKIVVAYEKLGGVIKNITTCRQVLLSCLAPPQAPQNVDS